MGDIGQLTCLGKTQGYIADHYIRAPEWITDGGSALHVLASHKMVANGTFLAHVQPCAVKS